MIHGSRLVLPATLALLVGGGAVNLAHAEGDHGNDIALINGAKTSLGQALSTAEQQTGGKALDAGVENENGNSAYAIEVVVGDTVQKVTVDPQTGKVLKVYPPHASGDHEDGSGDNESED